MMLRRYECVMDYEAGRMRVNVFTSGQKSKEELKPLALQRGVEFLEELGDEVSPQDITLVGYVDKGDWQ